VGGRALAGTLGIELTDSVGTTLDSRSIGVAPGQQQIGLGFAVTPGDYVLLLSSSTTGVGALLRSELSLRRSGSHFPYGSALPVRVRRALFFYDWQVTW